MTTKRHETGKRMSQCVVHGDTVYLAGQVASDPKADLQGQTRSVLEKIDALLAQAGTSKSNLLSAVIYLADMRHFRAMNEVWDAWVDPAGTPARATVGAALAGPEYLVEIMVVAHT
jgi:enamine deaminase RidA (YjgF/YER057c/UK114 family)